MLPDTAYLDIHVPSIHNIFCKEVGEHNADGRTIDSILSSLRELAISMTFKLPMGGRWW